MQVVRNSTAYSIAHRFAGTADRQTQLAIAGLNKGTPLPGVANNVRAAAQAARDGEYALRYVHETSLYGASTPRGTRDLKDGVRMLTAATRHVENGSRASTEGQLSDAAMALRTAIRELEAGIRDARSTEAGAPNAIRALDEAAAGWS